ncbi:MAG: serine hydrolase domain-containing protein [Armatimonadota bacterium]
MLVLIALQVASSATGAEPPAEATELIEKWLADKSAPGISVAAVNREGILWSAGFGLADVEAERPATAATRYQFASITKVYTALLLAQLAVEAGVDLDAPLSRYLPELTARYPEPGAREITLRDVATHTAGFTRDMRGDKASGRTHAYTVEELLQWQKTAGFTARPGLQYKYSNFGYGVLGAALERITGRPYRDLLRERVLEPLELTSTGFSELRTHPELARSYSVKDDELTPNMDPLFDFDAQAAASELISTVEDMARFAQAHLGNGPREVVPPAATGLLFAPHLQTSDTSAICLGWRYSWSDGLPRWIHTGSVNHFQSIMAIRPDVGIGLVLAANGPGSLGELHVPLLRLIAEHADTSEQDALVGDYAPADDDYLVMVRRRPDAVLTLEVKGAVRMVPVSRHTYRIVEGRNKGEWVRFVEEEGKQVLLWEHRRLVRKDA